MLSGLEQVLNMLTESGAFEDSKFNESFAM